MPATIRKILRPGVVEFPSRQPSRSKRAAGLLVTAWAAIALCLLTTGCSSSLTAQDSSGSQGNNSSGGFATVQISTLPPLPGYTPATNGATNPNPNENSRRGTLAATPVGNGKGKAHAGPAGLYPDPTLTPGDVFPGLTAQEVCASGYSKSVRSVSAEEKAAVYARYGITNTPGQHEVDHFISLELGGSNDLKNLWPEPYEPRPGAHEKDTVENALHAAICSGKMSLAQAQTIISQDWYVYYLQVNKP